MAGQLHGLRQQYESTTGLQNFNTRLRPSTVTELDQAAAAQNGAAGAGFRKADSGWTFNAARQQYRDANGRIYDKDGKPVTP
jgi:hypothetical protein